MKIAIIAVFAVALAISNVAAQDDDEDFWAQRGPQDGNFGAQGGNFGAQGGNFGPQGGNFGPQAGRPQNGNFGPQGGNIGANGPQQRPPTTPQPPRSTTQSLRVRNCIQACPATNEYNPVCGTNTVQYQNIGRLNCAKSCGVVVEVATRAACNPVT